MIVSRQNAFIKEIRSLSNKKYRDALGLYVAEGIKLVNEAIKLGLDIHAIVCTESASKSILPHSFRCELVSDDVFKSISSEVCPQGALAVINKPKNELTEPSNSCILLDGVSDPANVGAIIRTAVASGYSDIYLTSDCADAFSSKCVRASMSGVFRLNIHVADRITLLSLIKLPLVVGDMDGENIFTCRLDHDFCLVIGNEGNGVSQEVKSVCQKTVSIPMKNGMESLNAGVSAGILMYLLKNTNL